MTAYRIIIIPSIEYIKWKLKHNPKMQQRGTNPKTGGSSNSKGFQRKIYARYPMISKKENCMIVSH